MGREQSFHQQKTTFIFLAYFQLLVPFIKSFLDSFGSLYALLKTISFHRAIIHQLKAMID